MRTALFSVITKRVVVIGYLRFGTEYRVPFSKVKKSKSLHFLSLEDGPVGCAETSARNYHYLLRNNPAERSSHLLGGGNLRLHEIAVVLRTFEQFSSVLFNACDKYWAKH
jgi:hypothetical protein